MTANTVGCVSIPTFEATSYDDVSEVLTVTGLPADGSLALAFLTMGTIGEWGSGYTQRPIVYLGAGNGSPTGANITGLGNVTVYAPDKWAFVTV